MGVRRLLVYCGNGSHYHHSSIIDADRWPDDTVLLDLDRRLVCTKCDIIGGEARPNWNDRPKRESLVGSQWRQR
jgi:hypothetical protein